MEVAFGAPSREHVTTWDGITPCLAGLISSGRIPMARLLSHLVSGPGAGGLEKDFLHSEGDGHARPVREAADEGPRDLVRIAGLEGRREPLRPVRLLKGDVLGARGSR